MKKILGIVLALFLAACGGDDETQPPQETTIDPSTSIVDIINITDFGAEVSVALLANENDLITEKGVVWSTNTNPTIEDSIVSGGSGNGGFNVTITGLESGTQYNVRSFITIGESTIYSSSMSFSTTNSCFSNVFEGSIRLETQTEVEAFGAIGYCKVSGGLQIGTLFNDDERITDISTLSSIKEVRFLTINNTLLNNLNSLQNLVKTEIVSMSDNVNMLNIDGLSNVTSPIYKIRITNHSLLQNLDGLSGLVSMDANYAGSLMIFNNASLENIDGLLGITRWSRGGIRIKLNPLLTNLDGLSNINEIEVVDISIESNNSLSNIDGLSNFAFREDTNFGIRNNPLLNNIDVFSNVTSLGGFYMEESPGIENLNALSNLSSLGSLIIEENESLNSISDLANLDSLGSLYIRGNSSLQNLNGLENLSTIDLSFLVRNNNLLLDFCAITTLIVGGGLNGEYIVSNNAYNPTQQDIIDGNCSQ
jgi:hypothetical protein